MDILWAPWRIEYILKQKDEGCIFCTKPAEDNDRKNLILHRGCYCYIIMNYYPYNNGHLMVVPFRHIADLTELSEAENKEMMELLALCAKVLKQKLSPHGFNIGMNLGTVAGAGVKDHLHFHIVPRWAGDTNFMPLTANTKVIPEALEQTWEKLREGFNYIA